MGYTTAPWLGFGEALAAVAGALTGLLFVALSVKSDVLAASRSLSSRAAETLVLFMISVLIAVLLVAPQPPGALGAELLALAVVSGITLFVLDRRAGHASAQGAAAYIERFSPNTITAVLVGVAALTFLLKAGGGLYWLIPAAVASLLGGVGQCVAVPRQDPQPVPLTPCSQSQIGQKNYLGKRRTAEVTTVVVLSVVVRSGPVRTVVNGRLVARQ